MVKESLINPNLEIESSVLESLNRDIANYKKPLSQDDISAVGSIFPAYSSSVGENMVDLGEDDNYRVTPTISTPLGSQFNSEVIRKNNERRLEDQIALENQQDKNNQYKAQLMVDCLAKVAQYKTLQDEKPTQMPISNGLEQTLTQEQEVVNKVLDFTEDRSGLVLRKQGENMNDYLKRSAKTHLKGAALKLGGAALTVAGTVAYIAYENPALAKSLYSAIFER